MNARILKNYCDFLDFVKSHVGYKEEFIIDEMDEKLVKRQIKAWFDFFENLTQYIDNTELCNTVADYIVFTYRVYVNRKYENCSCECKEYKKNDII